MVRLRLFMMLLIPTFLLSGCLYPDELKVENQVPYESQVAQVQEAVLNYQKDNDGLLPIKTKESDTPKYQKFPIDFKKLVPRYLPDYPSNSFDAGGVFVYVIIDEETKPLVRLFDAQTTEVIRDMNIRINAYIEKHNYPPYKEVFENGVFSIDYDKLKIKSEPFVVSPFTNNNLSLLIDNNLQVFIDYRPDVYQFSKNESYDIKKDEDLLHLLAQNSMFVPSFSKSIYLNDEGEPTFQKGK